MKRYKIKVEIDEGNDEFWEALEGKSGADEVVAEVRSCLADRGFTERNGCSVSLIRYENTNDL